MKSIYARIQGTVYEVKIDELKLSVVEILADEEDNIVLWHGRIVESVARTPVKKLGNVSLSPEAVFFLELKEATNPDNRGKSFEIIVRYLLPKLYSLLRDIDNSKDCDKFSMVPSKYSNGFKPTDIILTPTKWFWDGMKAVDIKTSFRWDVISGSVKEMYSSVKNIKYYGTKEACLKDNKVKVVLFPK